MIVGDYFSFEMNFCVIASYLTHFLVHKVSKIIKLHLGILAFTSVVVRYLYNVITFVIAFISSRSQPIQQSLLNKTPNLFGSGIILRMKTSFRQYLYVQLLPSSRCLIYTCQTYVKLDVVISTNRAITLPTTLRDAFTTGFKLR